MQVCLFSVGGELAALVEGTAAGGVEDSVEVRVRPTNREEDLVPARIISIPPGQ